MRNILLFLFIIFLVSCTYKNNHSETELDSPFSFIGIGIKLTIPKEIKNTKYYIVNTNIAKVNFNYNNINYSYLASTNSNSLFNYLNTNDLYFFNNIFYYIYPNNKLDNNEELTKLYTIFSNVN